jgi:hypothetical protein
VTDAGDYDVIARLEAQSFAERVSASHASLPSPRLVQIQPLGLRVGI